MRIPLASNLETRTDVPDKDQRITNAYVEIKGNDSIVRKRSGINYVSVTTIGVAQGLTPIDNGVIAVNNDQLTTIFSDPALIPPEMMVAYTRPAGTSVPMPPSMYPSQRIGVLWILATQWNGTGVTMYSAKSPSAMKPYTLDGDGIHVPNVGVDVSATLNSYATAANVISLTELVPDSESYPFTMPLGWVGWVLNSSANLGVADIFLTELDATQVQEWANFTTIQTANLAALQAIPDLVSQTTGSTAYFSSAAAQAVIDAAVAAGGGTGNSYVVSDTAVGSFLSGAGTTGAGVITGAGTNSATYSRTRTLLGGYDVRKKTTRVYSIRQGATQSSVFTYSIRTSFAYAEYPAPNWVDFLYTPPQGDVFGEMWSLTSHQDCIDRFLSRIPNRLEYAVGSGWPANWDITMVTGSYFLFTSVVAGYIANYTWYRANGSPLMFNCWAYNAHVPSTANVFLQYIDYVDTTTLLITANPTITLDSTLTASQESIDLYAIVLI